MAQVAQNRPLGDDAEGAPGAGRLLIAGSWQAGAGTTPLLDKFHLRAFGEIQLPSRGQVSECVSEAEAD